MNLNGVEYWYIRNAQGDIIGLHDKDGVQVVSYVYDSWGKLVSINGTMKDSVGEKNPYRYREYRYDTETGLYYLQSRYYNPEWGRFVNADTESGKLGELLSHNVFAYCANNPINRYDPTGKWYTLTMFTSAVVSAVVVSSTVVIATAAVGFAGYVGYRYYKSTHGVASSSSHSSSGGTKTKSKSRPVTQPTAKPAKFPTKSQELDDILGVPGVKVPDGPLTPGIDKTKWKLPTGNVVTHEKHPYDVGAPDFHTQEHYHVDGPGYSHPRFSPGNPIPPIF